MDDRARVDNVMMLKMGIAPGEWSLTGTQSTVAAVLSWHIKSGLAISPMEYEKKGLG